MAQAAPQAPRGPAPDPLPSDPSSGLTALPPGTQHRGPSQAFRALRPMSALSDLAFGPSWASRQEQRSIPEKLSLVGPYLGLDGVGGKRPSGARNSCHLKSQGSVPGGSPSLVSRGWAPPWHSLSLCVGSGPASKGLGGDFSPSSRLPTRSSCRLNPPLIHPSRLSLTAWLGSWGSGAVR